LRSSIKAGVCVETEPNDLDNLLNCPQIQCPDAVETTSTRKYLTTSDCWNSSFNGQFFWRNGFDAPRNWARDDPITLACKGKSCTPVGKFQRLSKDNGLELQRMYRWRYESDCGIRSFFVNKQDRNACLQDKTILIVGDITLWQMFHFLVYTVLGRKEEDVQNRDCDPSEASGCYDCYYGCKNMKIWQRDYKTYFKSLNLTINFSWKPNIFTLDDRILLDRFL